MDINQQSDYIYLYIKQNNKKNTQGLYSETASSAYHILLCRF